MAAKDHLDKEITVSAKLTPTGVKASAKSKFLSGLDRLGGNLTELANVRMESDVTSRRLRMDTEKRILEAAAKNAVKRLQTDDQFADRTLEAHLTGVFQKQANKDGVLRAAIEDLAREPPSDAESNSGGEVLDEPFLGRLEHFAEFATTDELRERWGRVLGAEVRRPGTFSLKTLRVIDEMDPETAALFERFCLNRIGEIVPRCLIQLSPPERRALDQAGLLIDVPLGHSIQATKARTHGGTDLLAFQMGHYSVAVEATAKIPNVLNLESHDAIRRGHGADPTIPVYVLTRVGISVASILPNHERLALDGLAEAIARKLDPAMVMTHEVSGSVMKELRTFGPTSPPVGAPSSA